MIITITGPRSIGKSVISRLVAKKLKIQYVSSDEIGEKALKKEGGLDKAIKSGAIKKFIKKGAYNLIRNEYKKDNFVFDLSGGSISSTDFPEASKKVRNIAREKSVIIGLLPFKNQDQSIKILFKREKERKHFKNLDQKELLSKVQRNYKKFPRLFKTFCDIIIYTQHKTPEEISELIVNSITQGASK